MKTLKQTTLVIALSIVAAGITLAADASTVNEPTSRASVIAELDAARASGALTAMNSEDGGSMYLAQQAQAAPRSRDGVVAELMQARRNGTLDVLVGEDSGAVYLAATQPIGLLARAPDRNEFDTGLAAAILGEDSGSFYLSRLAASMAGNQPQVFYVGPAKAAASGS